MRTLIGHKRFPIAPRRIPLCALRGLGLAVEEGISLFIGCNHAGAGAALDGHVAHRHAAFHRQITDGFAGEFNDVSCAACRADFADDGENDVFRSGMFGELAIHFHFHVFGFFLDQGLRGKHMLDFRRADAMGQGTKRAMGGGVAIAANDCGAGEREALLRTDNVDDALALVEFVEILNAEVPGVLCQCFHLNAAFFLDNALGAVRRRHVVVDNGQGLFRVAHLAPGQAQAFKGLGARHFMNKMAVNIKQRRAILRLMDEMIVPDLVIKCAGLGHGGCPAKGSDFGRYVALWRGESNGLQPQLNPGNWLYRIMTTSTLHQAARIERK